MSKCQVEECGNKALPGKKACSWGHEIYLQAKAEGVSVSDIIRKKQLRRQ